MYNFNDVIDFIFESEGGYTVDTGGETKYGISKNAYPNLDIKNLTKEQAKEIYKRDYWDKLKCDKYRKETALVLFDTAVNIGIKRATEMVQEVCNKFLLDERNSLKIDGILGDKTSTIIMYIEAKDGYKFIFSFLFKRAMFYCRLSQKDKYRKYLLGWMNRVCRLADIIMK